MKKTPSLSQPHWIALGLCLALAGCGGASNAPPTAAGLTASLDEDTAYHGSIQASDPEGDPLTFSVSVLPSHGTVTINAHTGSFTYTPNPDYFGTDVFSVSVQAKGGTASANVALDVHNVYDPPRLQAISDQTNSAYALESDIPLDLVDVDGNPLTVDAQVDDAAVAAVQVQSGTPSLRVTPLARGATTITVTASDGQSTVSTHFQFTVGDVTKSIVVRPQASALQASAEAGTSTVQGEVASLANTTARTVSFSLTYNGHAAFTSLAEVVNYVQAMPEAFSGEPFARKLWRFVRDNTYHDVPIITQTWADDYWGVLNSLGSGFCDDVAALYVQIARYAGFDARLWGLNGHVVPEILADGKWQMFDPDLAVYYYDGAGQVAGVQELAADTSLIRSPLNPIFPAADAFVYSDVVADIYDDSFGNNYIADSVFLPTTPGGTSRIELPPGARLLLPGHWTEAPTGYDGDTPYAVLAYRQAAIELPPGWTGSLNLPWVLWDVQGSGLISLAGEDFDPRGDSLKQFLAAPGAALTSINVATNPDGLRLVFMINATWYDFLDQNDVRITGQDVWAIDISNQLVDQVSPVTPFPASLQRPAS